MGNPLGQGQLAKDWFYFVSSKLVPSKHVSKVTRDKAILLYAIVKGYKFNVGKIIESSILEFSYGKAISHPSLITKLCEIARMQIGENEEKCPPMLPLPFPQKKKTHPSMCNIMRELLQKEKNEKIVKKKIIPSLKPQR